MEMRTCKSVISDLHSLVKGRHPVSLDMWMHAAQLITVMQGEDGAKLIELEIEYNKVLNDAIAELGSKAKAEVRAKTTDIYKEYAIQKLWMKQIDDFYTAAKKSATLSGNEYSRS